MLDEMYEFRVQKQVLEREAEKLLEGSITTRLNIDETTMSRGKTTLD